MKHIKRILTGLLIGAVGLYTCNAHGQMRENIPIEISNEDVPTLVLQDKYENKVFADYLIDEAAHDAHKVRLRFLFEDAHSDANLYRGRIESADSKLTDWGKDKFRAGITDWVVDKSGAENLLEGLENKFDRLRLKLGPKSDGQLTDDYKFDNGIDNRRYGLTSNIRIGNLIDTIDIDVNGSEIRVGPTINFNAFGIPLQARIRAEFEYDGDIKREASIGYFSANTRIQVGYKHGRAGIAGSFRW